MTTLIEELEKLRREVYDKEYMNKAIAIVKKHLLTEAEFKYTQKGCWYPKLVNRLKALTRSEE